jgi:hypothetical protein
LDLANDDDGTISAEQRQMALPFDESARTRALLDQLLAAVRAARIDASAATGSAVAEVFLLPLPVVGYSVDPSAPAHETAARRRARGCDATQAQGSQPRRRAGGD